MAWAEQGEPQRALADLEIYLAHAEDALDLDAVADRLADLRRAAS
jgi:regulator of sirC expression with transglutaminase-like and TPR domain